MFTCKKLTWEKCSVRYQIWNSSHYNSVVTSKASHMMIYATIKSQSDLYVYIYFGIFGVPCLLFGCHYQTTQAKRSVPSDGQGTSVAKYSWKWNQLPQIHSKQSEAIQDSNCEAVILDLSRRSWISSLAFCMATDNCTFRSCEIPSTLRAHSLHVKQRQHPIVAIDSRCSKVNQPKNHSHWNKVKVGGSSRSTYFDIIFRYISHLSWKLVQTVPQLVLYLCFDLAAQTIPNVLSAHTHGEMPWRTLDGCGVLGIQLSNGERVSNFTIQSGLYDLQSVIKYDSK